MSRTTFVAVMLCVVPAGWAADKPADQLQKGSTWKGQGELADGKVDDRGVRLTDVTVKITERKGGTFKGEAWFDKGARGLAFTGTIADGSGEVVFTRTLNGDWARHWTGRKGTLQTAPDLLSVEFTGSRKTDTPADREHFKARLQAK